MMPAVSLSVALLCAPAQGGTDGGADDVVPGGHAVYRLDANDALPQASVTSLAQVRDGRLLLTTFGGLARFDGVELEVWDAARSRAMSSIRLTAVAAGPRGGAWVGSQGGALWRFDGTDLHPIVAPDDLGVVWALLDRDGLWVAAQEGLWQRSEDGGWTRHLASPAQRLAVLRDGVAVVHDDHLQLYLDDGDRPSVEVPGLRDVVQVGDELWVAGAEGVGVVSFTTTPPTVRSVDPRPAERLAPVGPRRVWAAWESTLFEVGRPEVEPLALPAPVRSVLVDTRGSVWVGTLGGGFVQVQSLPHRTVSMVGAGAVLPDRAGGVWLTRGCDAVVRRRDGEVVDEIPFEEDCPRALAHVDGEVWVGAGPRVGPLRAPDVWEVPDGYVLAIGPQGRWIGTSAGLFERGVDAPVVTDRVPALVEGRPGEVWAAGRGRVGRWRDGDGWEWWGHGEELPAVQVRDLWIVDDVAWAGTYGGGLWRVGPDGIEVLGSDDGLHENVISQILVDHRGVAWLNGNRGVTRVPLTGLRAALDQGRPLAARLWTVGEGTGGVQPAGALAGGEVWLPGLHGFTVFPVDHVPVNPTGPRTRLLTATVDGRPLEDELPPGPGRLELHYTAGALSHPDLVRFQLRLDGGPWQDLGARRRVVWEGLAPGPHQLALRAANEDGVWGPEAQRSFVLEAPVHQRWWFRGLILVGVLLVGGLLQRLRTRQVEARNRELGEQVAQREQVEAALREREDHYRRVFEGVGDGLLVVSDEGRITEANPAAKRLFADPRLVGRAVAARVGPTDTEGAQASPLVRCTRADGSTFPASVSILDDASGGQLVSITDVSALLGVEEERRRLENQVAQSQRLEAIGRLAGGVAHDFNNLLGGIAGAGFALREEVPGPATERLVEDIDACVERGARLTRQLMAFGRQQLLEPVEVSLQEQVAKVRPLLLQGLQGDVALEVDITADRWVRVDPSQLDVALLNLILNARAASAPGTTVRVEVGGADGEAYLRVVDEGEGMSAEVRERVLEPFFTTKATGTGLGLPSVHGFVTQSGGRLAIDSEVGRGTAVTLWFPSVEPTGPPTPLPPSEPPQLHDRDAVVLVCDDDPFVRRGIARVLQGAGVQVVAVADADEALAHLDGGHEVSLLLTDVRMPGVSGPELAVAARQRRPELPVVFVSGFVDDDGPELPGPLLAKPFDPDELLLTVVNLIEGEDVRTAR